MVGTYNLNNQKYIGCLLKYVKNCVKFKIKVSSNIQGRSAKTPRPSLFFAPGGLLFLLMSACCKAYTFKTGQWACSTQLCTYQKKPFFNGHIQVIKDRSFSLFLLQQDSYQVFFVWPSQGLFYRKLEQQCELRQIINVGGVQLHF